MHSNGVLQVGAPLIEHSLKFTLAHFHELVQVLIRGTVVYEVRLMARGHEETTGLLSECVLMAANVGLSLWPVGERVSHCDCGVYGMNTYHAWTVVMALNVLCEGYGMHGGSEVAEPL